MNPTEPMSNQWISVEERLPETPKGGGWSKAVLVCWKLHDPAKWADEFPGGWVITERRIHIDAHGVSNWDAGMPVTHWMPLPEPPRS